MSIPTYRGLFTLALALAVAPLAGLAKPLTYAMDTSGSIIGFATDFGQTPITGTMPVLTADMVLDFEQVANSRVLVSLNANGATASLPFAANAMKAAGVLDTTRHPKLTFRSTRITPKGEGAHVIGELTIRGVTRPVALDATIWRQQGTQAGDRSRLTIRLTGTIHRSDYGATGWADMVGDEVRLDIRARVHQAP